MIEYIRLDAFVFFPYFIAGKEIDLDRHTVFCRLQLADDQVEVGVYNRQTGQVLSRTGGEWLNRAGGVS